MTHLYQTRPARLEIGAVLNRVIVLLQRGFVAAWLAESGVCAILAVANLALTLAVAGSRAFSRPTDTSAFGAILGALALFILLLEYAAAVSLMTRAAMSDLDGAPVRVRGLAAGALPVVIPVSLTLIAYFIAVMVGYVFLFFPAIFISLYFSVVAQVRAAEPIGIFGAFGRSALLTENNRWAIFLLRIIWGVATGVAFSGMVILLGTFGALFGARGGGPNDPVVLGVTLLILPFSVVATAAFLLFNAALPAAIYAELRRLREGDRSRSIEQVFS